MEGRERGGEKEGKRARGNESRLVAYQGERNSGEV